MSYYKSVVLKDILTKKERKEKNISNGIEVPFKRYGESFSHIERGCYYQVLGSTGIGKSTFARFLFVYEALKYSWQNNYPIKILYLGLEDGKLLIYKKFVKHYLFERHGVVLPNKYIESRDMPLAQKYIDLLEVDEEFYEMFEQSVYIVNDAVTPTQIYDTCMKVDAKFGETHHCICIIDNFSNVCKEAHHNSDWEAVRDLSKNKIRLNLCLKHNWTVVGILQQDFESMKNAQRNAGKAGISAIEPSMSSIGDAKIVAKDSFVILALFNPNSFDIKSYPFAEGYNIDILRDRFRSVLMLKNNLESMASRLPLYFRGDVETFEELPQLDQKDELEKIYRNVMDEEKLKRERFLLGQKRMF